MIRLDHGGNARASALDSVGPVVVEMVGAHCHGVGERAGMGDVLLVQEIFADNAPSLAGTDVSGDRGEDVGVEPGTGVALGLQVVNQAHHLPPRM